MPIVETRTLVVSTVWVCDFCDDAAGHKAGTGSPLSAEYFIDKLRWLQVNETTVACNRCRILLNVLTAATI